MALNTAILRPNADISTGTSWGTTPLYPNLRDNTTATWAQTLTLPDTFAVALDNFAFPTVGVPVGFDARVQRIRMRAKVSFTGYRDTIIRFGNSSGLPDNESGAIRIPGTPLAAAVGAGPTIEDYIGPWIKTTELGAFFDPTILSNMSLVVSTNVNVLVYELYVDVEYYWEPIATITNPAYPAQTLGHYENFKWYFDNGGFYFGSIIPVPGNTANGTQKKYEVRIYSNAQKNAAAFAGHVLVDRQDLYPPIAASGIVPSARSTHNFTTLDGVKKVTPYGPAAGDWWLYVRLAKDHNGTDWWSDWTFKEFLTGALPEATFGAVPSSGDPRPTFTWLVGLLPFGDIQDDAEFRLYDNQTVTDPDVETEGLIDSQYLEDTTQMARTNPSLAPGNYRAFVRGRVRYLNEWTPWKFQDFTSNYVRPAAPTLSLTPAPATANVSVDPDWTAVGFYTDYDNLHVERSDDAGATWTTVYDTGTSLAPFTDEECPFNRAVYYRARVSKNISDFTLYSDWSTVATTTLTVHQIWIKCSDDPSMNARFRTADSWLETEITKKRSPNHPLGRTLPVVTKSEGRGESGEITFTLEDDEVDALIMLAESGHRLLLQMPKRQLYIEVSENYEMRDHLFDLRQGETDIRQITIPFIEVA